MKKNAFQFRRANEEDLPEICRIVKLAGEIVPVKEWFEAEDEEFLAKHIREEGSVFPDWQRTTWENI